MYFARCTYVSFTKYGRGMRGNTDVLASTRSMYFIVYCEFEVVKNKYVMVETNNYDK